MTRLQEHYQSTVKLDLIKEFGYKNAMQTPRLDKIVINM
ncbi:MAG TPA: 50S ribosomal protein L5, partial [Rhodospirillales bacterium]|nr:50S ribosomal protein L5 [Rhodospirillales bacterium]